MEKGDMLVVTQATYAYAEADTLGDDLGELNKNDTCVFLGEKESDFSFNAGKTLMIKCLTRLGPAWVIRRWLRHALEERRARCVSATLGPDSES